MDKKVPEIEQFTIDRAAMTGREQAERYGCSQRQVAYWAKAYGSTKPWPSKIPKEDYSTIRELRFTHGLTYKAIAEKWGVAVRAVWNICNYEAAYTMRGCAADCG